MKKHFLFAGLFILFSSSFAVFGADSLKIESAWARLVPPNAKNSAVYLTLQNPGNEEVKIISADFPVAQVTELHTIVTENEVKKMVQVKNFPVKAKSKRTFLPGEGEHVMLIGLKRPLKEGETLKGTLTTNSGREIKINAVVKRSKGMKHMKHMKKQ